MTPAQHGMHRFSSLDGFRGVFALTVALFHLMFASHLYAVPVLRDAYLFVDFFFVLSGFVITYAYSERLVSAGTTLDFVIRRFGRLWPLHVAVLGALVLMELVRLVPSAGLAHTAFEGTTAPQALPFNLLMLQSLYPHDTATWNIPSWSISGEFIAYLVFAAVSLGAGKLKVAVALAIIAISMMVIVASSRTGMDLTAQLGALRACTGFFAGNLAYLAFRSRTPVAGGPKANALELASVAAIVVYVGSVHGTWLGYFAPLVFAAAIYVFAGSDGIVSRLLRSGPLQYLGRISYSIYMVHYPLLLLIGAAVRFMEKKTGTQLIFPVEQIYGPATTARMAEDSLMLFGNAWVMDALTLGYVAVVLAVASLSYRFVEQPGQRLFGRLANAMTGHLGRQDRRPAGATG